ncbi:MAG: 2-polyprenylphenol 6-hydroxylase [Pseudomonadota bacterium]
MLRTLTDLFRLGRVAWILARHDALIPSEFDPMLPQGVRTVGKITRIGTKTKGRRPGQRLADALAGQGPAYVKFGQLLATRPDIVGFEMAADLACLQDAMPAFATEEARREVEKALGRSIDALFSTFSEPVAAASIAQVHKATTTEGDTVAVKVLRPGIEKKAQKEFRVLYLGARLVEVFVVAARRLEPVKFINTLKESSEFELDLRIEAGSASEVRDNLSDNDDLVIPKIDWQRSSRRVLTTEWVDGTPLSDHAAVHARADLDRELLAVTIMQCFLSQALEYGLFHADMHQGNLFVDAKRRLVLIDFGIMGRLDASARRAFAEILFGFITRDYQRSAKAHFEAGYVPDHFNVDAFATALRAVVEPIFNKSADQLDMSRVLQQLFDITDVFDMHLRPELVLLQRTMVVVEGVARMLDPKIDLWSTAEPIVRAYVQREIGPRALLKQARVNAGVAASLFESFPEFADAAEKLAGQLANGGLKLSDDTVLRLARAMKGKPLGSVDPAKKA